MASDATQLSRSQIAEVYAKRAHEARTQAVLARKFLVDLVASTTQ